MRQDLTAAGSAHSLDVGSCAEQAVRRNGGRICANLRLAQGQQVDRARQTDGGSGGRQQVDGERQRADPADGGMRRSTARRERIRRDAQVDGADGADVRESGRRMRRDGESSTKRRPGKGRDGGREKGPAAATAGGSGRTATAAGEEEGAGREDSTATARRRRKIGSGWA